MTLYSHIAKMFPDTELKENFPMSECSSFKVGGQADLVVYPDSVFSLIGIVDALKETNEKYIIVGRCSNILFSDDGYRGVVIKTDRCTGLSFHGDTVNAECGISLSSLIKKANENCSLGGIECLFGIPGSLGGALYMNAGAYGGEIYDRVVSVKAYDMKNNKVIELSKDEIMPSYRKTVFMERSEYVILSAVLTLDRVDKAESAKLMKEYMTRRHDKQPLEYPNAGSIFKRPYVGFAGKYIEDCGLKGYRVGDAEVSEKHAGFIVNRGKATAKDIKELIAHIKDTVHEKFGVCLETEVIIL